MSKPKAQAEFLNLYLGLQSWQRHYGLTDEQMGKAIGCSSVTWSRYKLGKTEISHEDLIRIINFLRIPQQEAAIMLMAGLRNRS